MLSLYEREYPGDRGPRHALEVARAFARGNATASDLALARHAILPVGVAGCPFAPKAVTDAVYLAAWEDREDSIEETVLAALLHAGVAVILASGEAAGDAERRWQAERLAWYVERDEKAGMEEETRAEEGEG